jgi:hypothetical protein
MRNKSFFILFFCLLFICSFSFVFANDADVDNGSIQEDINSPTITVVDITQLLNKEDEKDTIQQVEVLEPQLIEVNQTRTTVSPSDANGFKAVLLSVLGNYETVVTDYTYQNNSNYYSHSIEIEQDYAWICSAAMLGLFVYCTFRIIGGMLCKR